MRLDAGETGVAVFRFGSGQAGHAATVGFALKNADGSVQAARTQAGVIELGGGDYAAPVTVAAPWDGIIEADTGGGAPVFAREDLQVRDGALTHDDARLAHLDADVSSRAATADARFGHLDADVSSRLAAAAYTAPDNADVAAILAQLDDAGHGLAALLVAVLTRATPADIPPPPDLSKLDVAVSSRAATADARLAHLDADVSSRAGSAAWTAARAALLDHLVRDVPDVSALATEANVDTLLARLTAVRAAALDHLDADVSSRLAAAAYVAPDNADVAAALAQLLDVGHGLAAILAAVESRAAPGDLANLDAPISSRLAAADYVPPATALVIATAVWDALTADHVAVGSTGAALEAVAVAQDPLTKPVPSAYAPGTGGAALGRLAGGPLSIVSPLSRTGDLVIVAGDDYLFADGREIAIARADGDVWPADLTGWALRWVAKDLRGGLAAVEADSVTSPTPAGVGQSVRVELSAAVTSQLAPKQGATPAWVYGVEATNAGRRVTLRSGQVRLAAAP